MYGVYAALRESAKRVAQLPPGEAVRENISCIDRAKHMASVRTVPAPPSGKNTLRIPTLEKNNAAAKGMVLAWHCWVVSKPTMRLGGAAAIAAASSTASQLSARAKLWHGSMARARCKVQVQNTASVKDNIF